MDLAASRARAAKCQPPEYVGGEPRGVDRAARSFRALRQQSPLEGGDCRVEEVWAYYGPSRERTDRETSGQAGARDDTSGPASNTALQVGEVRDRGDVIEIPIVQEEVEVVKRPVVKEVLRVRKDQVPGQKSIKATVRKERVEVTHDVQDGDVVVGDIQDNT